VEPRGASLGKQISCPDGGFEFAVGEVVGVQRVGHTVEVDGVLTRSLRDGVLVFWVNNHAYRDGKWNLADQAEELTLGIADRVRAGGR
jgi:hypothetical protein